MTDGYTNDALEQEIESAEYGSAVRRETAEAAVPEKFKDKSAEDIIRAYTELETAYGRQANTIGQLRKSVDELLDFKSVASSPVAEPPKPLGQDELYENPDVAVRRVVREESTQKLTELEKKLQDTERRLSLREFDSRHPGWQQTAQSPEFQNWVTSTPYRQRLAQQANAYDVDAAEDLFAMFEEHQQGRKKPEDKAERDQQLRNATLETNGASPAPRTKTFSRYDLLQKRVRAKQGDRNAEMWLNENAMAIQQAYEQGRIVD